MLKDEIIYYNRYLAKKENDNSIETLRKIQLKEIQENYAYYDNIRKSNPENMTKWNQSKLQFSINPYE